jgi:hypothetical protein
MKYDIDKLKFVGQIANCRFASLDRWGTVLGIGNWQSELANDLTQHSQSQQTRLVAPQSGRALSEMPPVAGPTHL